MSQPITPQPRSEVDLADYSPDYTGEIKKSKGKEERHALRRELGELQDLLYADRRYGILVVLQGTDTSGKDSSANSVFEQVGPVGCSVMNFGVPSAEEASHDFLWRYHEHAPERGKIAIFNRSHYEAVLAERVKNIVPESIWRPRYDQINRFEDMLVREDVLVLKFFLHISHDEQRVRLQERVDNPKKHWKFRAGDLEDRNNWDNYQAAFADMLSYCNTEYAPWHIVPSDHKWYRDVVILRALVARLKALDLRYPMADEDISGLVVI
jgi:PPK2 family polyphosphate:nucleotide phosphotransferase